MADLVTKPELITKFDISLASFNNYLAQGMPCKVKGRGGEQSLYDLAEVKAWLDENVKSKNEELFAAKLRKAIADASLAELQVEREKGLVIPIDEAIAMIGSNYTSIRQKFLGLPTQLCYELVALTEPLEIQSVIEQKIIEILEELTADTFYKSETPEKKVSNTKRENK